MSMQPGRELDAKVAEVVMGWAPHFRNTAFYVKAELRLAIMASFEMHVSGWKPSESWEGMRLVLERMRELGWTPYMAIHEERWDEWNVTFVKVNAAFSRTAAEMPHAVCLAALAAIEGEGF